MMDSEVRMSKESAVESDERPDKVAGPMGGRTKQKESTVIVTISARHMEVTEPLRVYADQKAAKLLKYYDRIQEIEVIFDAGKGSVKVEMIVNAEHRNMFIANHNEGDAYACIDGCVHKLERQLSEHKDMFRNRKHPEATKPVSQP